MDLRQVCSFLLDGIENFGIENDNYENRLKNGSNSIYRRLENIYQLLHKDNFTEFDGTK